MTVITLTVPAVAETIQRWFGYIPGFGLVQDDKVRTLVEPQNQTVNGITLSVDEVIASSDKTLVKYSIFGIEENMKIKSVICPGANSIPINSSPVMQLSDGSKLQDVSLGVVPDNGKYKFEATYSPIPLTEQNVAFSLECLWQTENGSSLWSFQVQLQLTDNANVELTIAPVVEIPTEIPQNGVEGVEKPSTVGGNMEVNQVIPLEDGYILQGSLTIEPESRLTVNLFSGYLEDLTIRDANNVTLTTSLVPNDFVIEANEIGSNKINWAVQVNETNIAWPLTITVSSIPAVTEPYASSTFQVEVGD